jgi:hypothetical protein
MRLCDSNNLSYETAQEDSKAKKDGSQVKQAKSKAKKSRNRLQSPTPHQPLMYSQTKGPRQPSPSGNTQDSTSQSKAAPIPDILGGFKRKNLEASAQKFTDEIEAAFQREVESLMALDVLQKPERGTKDGEDVLETLAKRHAQPCTAADMPKANNPHVVVPDLTKSQGVTKPKVYGQVMQVPIRPKRHADEMDVDFAGVATFRKRQRIRNLGALTSTVLKTPALKSKITTRSYTTQMRRTQLETQPLTSSSARTLQPSSPKHARGKPRTWVMLSKPTIKHEYSLHQTTVLESSHPRANTTTPKSSPSHSASLATTLQLPRTTTDQISSKTQQRRLPALLRVLRPPHNSTIPPSQGKDQSGPNTATCGRRSAMVLRY